MSLPLVPPPQLLSVDDVLPVEIIEDADTGWQDLREHLAREHFVGSSQQDAEHRVVVVPKAVAILVRGAGRFDRRVSMGFWADPQWDLDTGSIRFVVAEPWYAISVGVRSSDTRFAIGWGKGKSGPIGAVWHPDGFFGVDAITIAVYGDK